MDEQKKKEYLAQLNSGIDRSTEEEIKAMEHNINIHRNMLDWVGREIEAKKELFDLLTDKPKPLELRYEYEKEARFWELNKILSRINHEKELAKLNNERDGLKRVIQVKEEELERLKGEAK
jgi:hypothetical protein